MKPEEIRRLRLHNLRLTSSVPGRAADVVSRLVAVQSQDYGNAKWMLGLRLHGAFDDDVEQAYNSGAILRTHVLRPTWHFVLPADIGWLLALTGPRVQAANRPLYRKLELDEKTLQRTLEALQRALEDGRYHTRDELRDNLEAAGIRARTADQRMAYIMMNAELEGVVCSGPRRGKQFTYALVTERAPAARSLEPDAALAELSGRFVATRGPVSAHDFAKWSGLTVNTAKRGFDSVKTRFESAAVDGATCLFPAPPADLQTGSPVVHLLSIYDEYISSYRDRTALGSAEYGARLVGKGAALVGVVTVDGRIVGTWKRTLQNDGVRIEPDLFERLSRAAARALERAEDELGRYLRLPVLRS